MKDIEAKIDAWFQRRFGHITPGTPDHAVALAAKNDLIETLAPGPDEAAEKPRAKK